MTAPDRIDVDAVATALRHWIDAAALRSYDPYDGLDCRWPWSLVRRHRLTARAWTQLIKRSPINLRPLVGIRPRVLAKTYSDLASAAFLRHRMGDPAALAEGRRHLEALRAEACPGYAGACWALPTPYVSRFVAVDAGSPNLFWTLNAAVAFLESFEIDGRDTDLRMARSAAEFALRDLGYVDEGDRGTWFRYYLGHDAAVFNVTALMAALLERLARYTGEPALQQLAERGYRFIATHQNADGSWYYARGASGRWVDGFHTGYVLEAVLQTVRMRRQPEMEAVLQRGVRFYRERLFEPDGRPRYAATARGPYEVQNCAQAIQTLARLTWWDASLLASARRVTARVVEALYHPTRSGPEGPRGYFDFSRGRWFRNRLPAVRWGQAPMLLALESLRAAERGLPPSWEQRSSAAARPAGTAVRTAVEDADAKRPPRSEGA